MAEQETPLTWPKAVEYFTPSIVKIATPRGTGTGFILASSKSSNICGIATAAHVVDASHYWEEPIRIHHVGTQATQLLRPSERAIVIDERLDTAVLMLERKKPFDREVPLPLTPEGKHLKVGFEVGWLGFPAVSPNNLCFFTGRTSCFLPSDGAYLIDGVVINGVSGGPAFHIAGNVPITIGIVSAYIANRATGELLPGLGVVQHVAQFHTLIKQFSSMDEAKKKETSPTKPPQAPQLIGSIPPGILSPEQSPTQTRLPSK